MSQIVATHIELRPNRDGQERAFVEGTRVRVQDIAIMSEVRGQTPDEIVCALPHLTLAQVHAALSYYFDHQETIRREMTEDAAFVQAMRAKFGPGPLEARFKSGDGSSDAVSS